MQPILAIMGAIRREIMDLLEQQMAVLNSPLGLTDSQLRECYLRQNRVQQLRELLQSPPISDQDATAGQGITATADPVPAEQCL
jgi:hypothetical protein